MKKLLSAALLLALLAAPAGCADTNAPGLSGKEGIAPYEYTERETSILRAFGLESTSQLLTFRAPKEAQALYVRAYRLNDALQWDEIGNGAMGLSAEEQAAEPSTGTFAMQLLNNYALSFHFTTFGRGAFQTDEILLESDEAASAKTFLREFQPITLNEEMPVALLVYDSGTALYSNSLQDFFEPEKLRDMDLVQAVTLEFSEEALGGGS